MRSVMCVCLSVCVSVCLYLFSHYRHQIDSWAIPMQGRSQKFTVEEAEYEGLRMRRMTALVCDDCEMRERHCSL